LTSILVENVTVDIPVLSMRARSLRTVAVARAKAIGGRLIDHGTQVPIMRALDNVSFALKEGDRLGLLGPNGAGKTTLIRVLADIYTPTTGTVVRDGHLLPMFVMALGFDMESTGYENIQLRCTMQGMSRQQIAARIDDIAAFSELGEFLSMPIRTYSAGMLLRLMFSIATSVQGDIVLMDEWISVGDETFRQKAQQRMLELTSRAGILVIASHEKRTLLNYCNLGLRLERGKVAAFGPIAEVLDLPAQPPTADRKRASQPGAAVKVV
jgi:ABC-type polysaccharide/polyol phosphate transport system ATPase subunit